MLTVVDDRLRHEVEEYDLRYTCESCAHFDEGTRRCAEGYPNGAHLDRCPPLAGTLEFCKSFELS